MQQLSPDLWQLTPYTTGMPNTQAFFLTHPDGNFLIYNSNNPSDLDQREALGGIAYQLLSHRDEAAASLVRIRERFGSKLVYATPEADAISAHCDADLLLSATDQKLGPLDVLFTPGHTSGSLCFFYASPHGQSYLFTGDTLFLSNGKWSTLILESSGGSQADLRASLAKMGTLQPDLVLSSAYVGQTGTARVSGAEWQQALAQAQA